MNTGNLPSADEGYNMNGHPIATTGPDPFQSYGAKVGLQGTFLSFKNGEFLAGQDAKEVPLGTRLVANMEGLRIGWRRWFDNKVTDDLTELLTDMVPLQSRNTLGDDDPAMWEKDNRGEARDPWQLTNILELADDKGDSYIYSTGSKGGINAIGRLCKAYGQQRRQHPGQVPVLELGRDHYMHPEFGKMYFPVFTIVGWMDESEAMASPEVMAGGHDLPFDGDEAAPAAKTAASTAPTVPAAKRTKF